MELINHISTDKTKSLTIFDLDGSSIMNNYGVGRLDYSHGANVGKGIKFDEPRGYNYSSEAMGGGLSLTPVSFTQTGERTWIKPIK